MAIGGGIGRWLTTLSVSSAMIAIAMPVGAADHRYHRHYPVLPPERHVIEIVRGAYGSAFIINGARFSAKTAACTGWVAGDRIQLLAGSWNGACAEAVFRNVTRRQTCEMWCG